MDTTPDERPVTSTGTARCVLDPSPSWPLALLPQHLTAPVEVRAQGADQTIDRGADLVGVLGRASVDVVVDLVGGPQTGQLLDLLRPGGRYAISGAIAGLAGFLFAVKDGFVNPELLSWHLSGSVLIMIILGGLGHLRGAVIGAFALTLLQELFQSEAVFGSFAKHWHLGLGLTIIVCVAVLPHGLIGLPGLVRQRLFGDRA